MNKILKIIDSATELFAQKGFDNTKVQEIANHADIAAGTIIYHFKSKNNILFIIMRGFFLELIKYTESNLSGSMSPIEQVSVFVRSFFNYFDNNKKHLLLCIKSNPFMKFNMKEYPQGELYIIYKKYERIFKNIVEAGIQANLFNNVNAERFSTLVIIMLFSAASSESLFVEVPNLSEDVLSMIKFRLFPVDCLS